MMRGWRRAVLFSLGLCVLYPLPAFAGDWKVWVPDSQAAGLPSYRPSQGTVPDEVDDTEDDEYVDEVELINDLATGSDWQYAQQNARAAARSATPADAFFVQNDGVSLYANYSPYDSSMSSSVVTYYDDIVDKLGAVHYVLFRSGQYDYRLVYGKDLALSGSRFSGGDCSYIAYSTRNYTWQHGVEGDFTLNAGSYLVYSDLGGYPALAADSVAAWAVVFCAVVYLLYVIIRAFLSPQRFP